MNSNSDWDFKKNINWHRGEESAEIFPLAIRLSWVTPLVCTVTERTARARAGGGTTEGRRHRGTEGRTASFAMQIRRQFLVTEAPACRGLRSKA